MAVIEEHKPMEKEKRRALGRGLDSLLPSGPRVVAPPAIPPTAPMVVPPVVIPTQGTSAVAPAVAPEISESRPELVPTVEPAQIDEIHASSHVSQNRRDMGHPTFFCCVAGVGIDTAIARRANALPKWLRGRGGYALSAPREFIRYSPFPMKVSPDGTQGSEFRPTLLAAVANAPAYGGGMKVAPHAQLDDGKLDLCVIEGMNVFKLFCLFPTVFWGRHLGIKQVRYEQTERIRIETELPLDVFADGEHVGQTPVEFSVAGRALKVISPE